MLHYVPALHWKSSPTEFKKKTYFIWGLSKNKVSSRISKRPSLLLIPKNLGAMLYIRSGNGARKNMAQQRKTKNKKTNKWNWFWSLFKPKNVKKQKSSSCCNLFLVLSKTPLQMLYTTFFTMFITAGHINKYFLFAKNAFK